MVGRRVAVAETVRAGAGVVAGGIAEAVAAAAAAGVEEDGFAQVDEACGRGAHGGDCVLPFSCRALLGRVRVLARLG